MSYQVRDDYGQEIYLSMLSDWDMDAAIQSASNPCLQLKVDAKPFEEGKSYTCYNINVLQRTIILSYTD
jgi:hypothetical protein